MKVLIIQQDITFAKELRILWKTQGKHANVTGNYEEALSFFHQGDYDVIVLDTWIKGGDAFLLAEKFRQRSPKVALFFLSEDTSYLLKKRAFEAGADVFLGKGSSIEEISWYLNALGRRVEMQKKYQEQHLYWKNIKVDLLEREVYEEGRRIELTGREFTLFSVLLKNRGLVLHRDMLRREVCGEEEKINSNIIDTYVKNIRKKIRDYNREGIKTIRGYGYGIEEEKKGE